MVVLGLPGLGLRHYHFRVLDLTLNVALRGLARKRVSFGAQIGSWKIRVDGDSR